MIRLEQIGMVIEYMNDHYRNFNGLPMDIEINGITYDLSSVIDSIQKIKELDD